MHRMIDVVYDGDCAFCRRSLNLFRGIDLWHRIRWHDGNHRDQVHSGFPELADADLEAAMFAVTADRRVHRGFFAVRCMMWESPLTWPLLLLFYFPGAAIAGPRLYAVVARNRRRLGCASDVCEPSHPHARSHR